MAMKALFFGLTLLKSPWVSSTKTPVDRSTAVFKEPYVGSQMIRIKNHNVAFRVSSDKREGDKCRPGRIKPCDIHFIAAPIWSEAPTVVKVVAERQIKLISREKSKPGNILFMGRLWRILLLELKIVYRMYAVLEHNLVCFLELLTENPTPVNLNDLLRRHRR